ncbi:alpha/beta fold hydrolase [Paracoccus sediminilitoris]|uniref:alpha/beta fold hydrolase n=1 Tax=Paracoccus sediminilitoris TaxID=2202419 RepID=UPI000DBA860E|nr:alpha/beta hydrolase [Paracoccus sediminilitoris]
MQQAPFHQLPDDRLAPASAFFVTADDGKRLRLGLWEPEVTGPHGTVLLFPGRTEYIEKYAPVARRLTDRGYAVLAIDWRGQGMSDRLQDDPRPGHIIEFSDYQRDVIEMVVAGQHIGLPEPWHLLAHSMGGCIGLAALENDLPVRTAVFSAPMWGINLRRFQHGAALGIAYLAGRLGRGGLVAPGSGGANATYTLEESFNANLLTGNVDEWTRLMREAAAWPDLTIGGASFDWVGKALNECSRLSRIASPDVPTLVGLGTEEKVVSARAIRDRVASWPKARLLEVEGARHEILLETPDRRDAFIDAMVAHFEAS